MNKTMYAEMNLVIGHEVNNELGALQVAYMFDDLLIDSIKIKIRNISGEEIEVDAKDWFVRLEGYDKD